MTMLQIKGAAPKAFSTGDVFGMVDQVMKAAGAIVPIALSIAYFLVVLVILWRIARLSWGKKPAGEPKLTLMELIGLAIALALMRGV